MTRQNKTNYCVSGILFAAFLLFTLLTTQFDVRPIGPHGTTVGFASWNQLLTETLGFNLLWYTITDWLGIVALLFPCCFALIGFCQMIRRRSLFHVDRDLFLLGLLYLAVIGCYLFFEHIIINYRPLLLSGKLEASYPSSHVMIVVSLMASSLIHLRGRIKNRALYLIFNAFAVLLVLATVIGRFLSGVHWPTDLIGGLLLSSSLIMMYHSVHAHLFSRETSVQ